ncbi:hypothetical protein MGH68_01465 [Erysipelothrix sp. D19-032]
MKISQASDQILQIETELFAKYSEYVSEHAKSIHAIGDGLATLDVLVALAEISALPWFYKTKSCRGALP